MHLLQRLHDGQLVLKSFPGKQKPPYAILSHTWGDTDDEVTYQDIKNGTATEKPGYEKIRFCAERIVEDDLKFVWIDTCCIDKRSSSELSEAIVSMFKWYQEAAVCYVYLSDVSSRGMNNAKTKEWMPQFKASRWFTRGWTLQELIAPKSTVFFSREKEYLGDRHELVHDISTITGIGVDVLEGKKQLSELTYDERVSWMLPRNTQKDEDRAYSLLGILDVHTIPCYGEGYFRAISRVRMDFRAIHSPLGHTKANSHKPQKGKATKWPRMVDRCRTMRPLCRMYEPLVLLYTLTTTEEDYVHTTLPTTEQTSFLPLKIARRNFLEDLAYLCDYDIGNDTVVAMAIQSDPQRQVLWIASNTSPTRQIISFVESRLADVQDVLTTERSVRSKKVTEFVTACIEFAAPQIHDGISCLVAAFHQCKVYLEMKCAEEVPRFLEWIGDCVHGPTIVDLCRAAYRCQRSKYMNRLARLSLQHREQLGGDGVENPFDLLRRQMTHLGRRFQAAKALLIYAPRLPEMNGNVEVRPLPIPSGSRLPPADPLTNFNSILVRMGVEDPRSDEYRRALAKLDVNHGLFCRFLHNYKSGNIQPFVHAEMQILDLFHTKQYSFIGDDRFIACSRPSCWSCSTYFTSHPAGVELSATNRSICLSWRPPFDEDQSEVSIEKGRSCTMDEFNKRSRREALRQLLKSSSIPPGRPGFPTIAPDLISLGQDRISTTDYLEMVTPLRDLFGPCKPHLAMSRIARRNENPGDEVAGLQQKIISPCSQRHLEDGVDESDSDGGVMIPTCSAT